MQIKEAIKSAKDILSTFDFDFLQKNKLKIDRVHDNPEAGRYFMMFAEWNKINSDDIFQTLDKNTAQNTHLYIDFVFCKKLCDFCAFYGVVPKNPQEVEQYVECLIKEVHLLKSIYFQDDFQVASLEYGGGTPTFLSLNLIKKFTDTLFKEFPFKKDIEFNFEASPETLVGSEGLDKLKYFKEMGANRMSIGVQSFEEKILKNTNRPHNLEDIHLSFENTKKIGFDRINVDLLLGLNGQTIESFLDSVIKTLQFDVDILELYTLRYFDTKNYIHSKNKLDNQEGFWPLKNILIARIAAHLLLDEAGYTSSNGRTYDRKNSPYNFYAAYYEGNFSGQNTLGLGRKSNSNVYPWQYANYRNLEKYQSALSKNRLPIATGTQFSLDQRAAKLLTGAVQLYELLDYPSLRQNFSLDIRNKYDKLFDDFIADRLMEKEGEKYKKTFLGFFFLEEMLKKIYDIVVTPYSSFSLFLGEKQAG